MKQIKYLLSLLAFVVFALTLGGCGGGSSSKSLDSSNYSEVDTLDTLEDSDYYSDTTDYSPTEDTYSSSSDDESEESEMCTMTSDCIGAVSEDVFDEVIKYSNAKDKVGLQQLAEAGLATVVHEGDRGKILDPGVFKTQVRFEDGRALYVPTDYVHKE